MNTLPILIAIMLSSFFGGPERESTSAGSVPTKITVKPAAPKLQTFHLAENSGKNSRVGTVSIPQSAGTNGLKFKITAGNAGGLFSINSRTGELRVANSRMLDFEKHAFFELTVKVAGSRDPLRQSFAEHLLESGIDWKSVSGLLGPQTLRVVIKLDNVNETPVLRTGVFLVEKKADFSKPIGRVKGVDPDKGDRLTYSIIAGNTAETFAIGKHSGEIRVKNRQAMSPGHRSRYALTVQAKDSGGLSATTTAVINVAWVNHAPTLTAGSFRLDEQNSESKFTSGRVVGRMTASDPDLRDRHVYRITAGNSDGAFAIEPGTGEITVADAELLGSKKGSSFKLTVQVQDLEGATAEALATIEIDRIEKSANTDETPVPVETGNENEIAGIDVDSAATDSTVGPDADSESGAGAEADSKAIDDAENTSIAARPNYGMYTLALGLLCGLVYLLYLARVSRSRWQSARKKEEVANQLKKRMAVIDGSADQSEEESDVSEAVEETVDLAAFRAAAAERARKAKQESLRQAALSNPNAENQKPEHHTERASALNAAVTTSSEELDFKGSAAPSQVACAIDHQTGSSGDDVNGAGDGGDNTTGDVATGDDVISRELLENDASKIDTPLVEQAQMTDESDADAVAEYMERLLAEARGETYRPSAQPAKKQHYDQPGSGASGAAGAAGSAAGSTDGSSGKRKTSTAASAGVERGATARTSAPRPSQNINAIRAELDSMREVANLSARTAIAWHDLNKQRRQMWLPCLLGIVAFGVSGALLTGAAGTTPTIPGGSAAAVVGGMMILKMIHAMWTAGSIKKIAKRSDRPNRDKAITD